MNLDLFLGNGGLADMQALREILGRNGQSARYGLALSQRQAAELIETRSAALKDNGRIEFGGGTIEKIIAAFCDSPYIMSADYAETLHELVEIFYYYKNETLDQIGDDELIRIMKKSFDGVCRGSLELLYGRELDRLARDLRGGRFCGRSGVSGGSGAFCSSGVSDNDCGDGVDAYDWDAYDGDDEDDGENENNGDARNDEEDRDDEY